MLLVLGTGCRTTKVISQVTRTDSTTTINHRAIALEIKPATLSDSLNLYTFTHTFDKAAVGAVLSEKRGKRVSYTIRKTSKNNFDVEAVAEKIDTTVVVADTTKRVHQLTTITKEIQPTAFTRAWQGIKDYALFAVLILVVVLVVLKRIIG